MKLIRISKQDYTMNGEPRRADIISVGKKLTIIAYRKSRFASKRVKVYKDKCTRTAVMYCHLPF